jgi:hypothetical protein
MLPPLAKPSHRKITDAHRSRRFAIIPAQKPDSSGDAPRGQAGARACCGASHRQIHSKPKDGIMSDVIIILAIIFFVLAIMFLESTLRVHWVKTYYRYGIKIYERKFILDQKKLIDIYAELNKIRDTDKFINITFRLTDENDHIYFRNKYDNKVYRNYSLLHGAIKSENGAWIIMGYIGLTEVLYICAIPYILSYFYFSSKNVIFIPLVILVFVGNIIYSVSNYFKTKKFLDGI